MVDSKVQPLHIRVSIRRRDDWTQELILWLKEDGLTVDIVDGIAAISYDDKSPDWVREFIRQHGLESIPIAITDIRKVDRVGGILVYWMKGSSLGWWKEPFSDAQRFLGRPDIDSGYLWLADTSTRPAS